MVHYITKIQLEQHLTVELNFHTEISHINVIRLHIDKPPQGFY